MPQLTRFACIVVQKSTGKELFFQVVEAIDWYYARHKVADMYEATVPCVASGDWYVDSCEI